MEKRIHLKFQNHCHFDFLGMHIPEKMEASELLKIINADGLRESNEKHKKHDESYKNSGELKDRDTYEVHTDNLDETLDSIKKYNHNNSKN